MGIIRRNPLSISLMESLNPRIALFCVGNAANLAFAPFRAGISPATGESDDAEGDSDADSPVEAIGGATGDQENLLDGYGFPMQ